MIDMNQWVDLEATINALCGKGWKAEIEQVWRYPWTKSGIVRNGEIFATMRLTVLLSKGLEQRSIPFFAEATADGKADYRCTHIDASDLPTGAKVVVSQVKPHRMAKAQEALCSSAGDLPTRKPQAAPEQP